VSPIGEEVDVLTVTGLKAYYRMAYFGVDREVRAVDDVTLSVRKNEIYGIAGESSSGKTTLIKTFASAIRPPLRIVGGSMTYHFKNGDIDPYAAPKAKVDALRWSHLSYIMQGSMSLLNPVRRIRRTFEDFAFRPMGLPSAEFWGRVEAHLQRLDLSPSVLSAYPHQLSGGMRQRVTIALATVCQPEFVIADEPTTALDVVVQKDVLAMIRDVQRQMGSSVVFVTHDMSVHASIADRIGIMYAGRLVEEGPTRALFAAPRHPYTAHLVASLPRIGDTTPKAALEGRPPNLAEPPTGCRFHPRCPLAIEKCTTDVPPLEPVGLEHRSACWRSVDVRPLARIGSAELEVAT
jgi:peptide/nickel transport system ATP-binding protein